LNAGVADDVLIANSGQCGRIGGKYSCLREVLVAPSGEKWNGGHGQAGAKGRQSTCRAFLVVRSCHHAGAAPLYAEKQRLTCFLG